MDAGYDQRSDSMGIRIAPKTNYSALFSSLPTNNSSVNSGFSLADYATIKNGSYYKLMKAYYGKNPSEQVESIAGKGASLDTTAVNARLQSTAGALKKSSNALLSSDKDSVFLKKEISVTEDGVESKRTDYDRDAIQKAVETFAKDYNGMLDAAKSSRNGSVLTSASNMVTQTAKMENILARVGIYVGEDNKLSVDAEELKKADISTLKSVFHSAGSFAYMVQSKASSIELNAKSDIGKANGIYSQEASYTLPTNQGSIFSSYF